MSQSKFEVLEKKLNRKIRILSIGNIANNAYNNAVLLNQYGFDVDVICYDYYHSMSYPEWEHVGVFGSLINADRPNFTSVDLNGFERPKWFAQGPAKLCIDYLISKRANNTERMEELWWELSQHTLFPSAVRVEKINSLFLSKLFFKSKYIVSKYINIIYGYFWVLLMSPNARIIVEKKLLKILGSGNSTIYLVKIIGFCIVLPNKLIQKTLSKKLESNKKFQYELIKKFKNLFPSRSDQLTIEDLNLFTSGILSWKTLIGEYDLIIAYATDPIIPMLVGGTPYIAYEHGTIRDIPFQNSSLGRLTALSYALADVVYMTNADSITQAKKLQEKKIIYGLHGFNSKKINQLKEYNKISGAPQEIKHIDKKIFFSPARQHWKKGFRTWLKGNDKVIHAVEKLTKEFPSKFIVVLVEWGDEVKDSKELIQKLGIDEYFKWVLPMPKNELFGYYLNVDGIIDQFVCPCIGSVTLDAIAIGSCPVITKLDDDYMREFYGETIPLLNCSSVEDIALAMKLVISEQNKAKSVAKECSEWFSRNHSEEKLLNTLLEAVSLSLINYN